MNNETIISLYEKTQCGICCDNYYMALVLYKKSMSNIWGYMKRW